MGKKANESLTDQLKRAIDDSGLTRYRIAKETGIGEPALSRFYNGKAGLTMKALNALGDFLNLKLVADKQTAKKKV